MDKPRLAYHPGVGKRTQSYVNRLRSGRNVTIGTGIALGLTAYAGVFINAKSPGMMGSYYPVATAVAIFLVLTWLLLVGVPLVIRAWLVYRSRAFWLPVAYESLRDLLRARIASRPEEKQFSLRVESYLTVKHMVELYHAAEMMEAKGELEAAQELRDKARDIQYKLVDKIDGRAD